METGALEINNFPYRHRVSELMAMPLITLPGEATVAEAARRMTEHQISSIVVLDVNGRLDGILTERDVLRTVARDVGSVAEPIGKVTSRFALSVISRLCQRTLGVALISLKERLHPRWFPRRQVR